VRRRRPDRRGPLISAGLDYPGWARAQLPRDTGRAEYLAATDQEALAACRLLATREGIIPALESAHAVAGLPRVAAQLSDGASVIVQYLGPGDKDMDHSQAFGAEVSS